MGNLDGRHYEDIYAFNLQTGERKLARKQIRWLEEASPAGTAFAYYDDGNYFIYDMTSGKFTNITKSVPTSFIDTEDDHNVVKPPTPFFGWSERRQICTALRHLGHLENCRRWNERREPYGERKKGAGAISASANSRTRSAWP